MVNHIRVFYIC